MQQDDASLKRNWRSTVGVLKMAVMTAEIR